MMSTITRMNNDLKICYFYVLTPIHKNNRIKNNSNDVRNRSFNFQIHSH